MDLLELQRKLMAAARENPPGDAVPWAFEKRVMARLGTRVVPDVCSLWSKALWQAAAPCTAIMLLLGAWSWLGPSVPAAPPTSNDWSQDFDNTVLAAAEPEQSADSTW